MTDQGQPTDGTRARAILEQMTLEEKIDFIGGTGFATRAIPRLGVPAIEMSDGPAGVRSNHGFSSTTYASGIGLAASWNPALAVRVGEALGRDARARGIHIMLGPGVNIYRAPMNGRNFEYFGEDPLLAAAIAVGYIRGMQSTRVSATIKHFLGNNSEYNRHNVNTLIDERTLREIYLPAFEAAVRQADVGAIMDAYNLLDGDHLTQSAFANVRVAREDWGFAGVMMSDWVATYDGVAAASNGLDLEMPTGAFMNRANLLPALRDGRLQGAMIDEKVYRILHLAERFGWLDHPQTDATLSTYSGASQQVALESAREAIVLLKNERGTLPLERETIRTLLVVGPNAFPAVPMAGGSGHSLPYAPVSILQGLGDELGPGVTVFYQQGVPGIEELARQTHLATAPTNGKPGAILERFDTLDLSGQPTQTETMRAIAEKGVSWEDLGPELLELLAQGASQGRAGIQTGTSRRWRGYYEASEAGPYEISALGSGENTGYRVYVDGTLVLDDWAVMRAIQDRALLTLSAGMHKVVVEDFVRGPLGGRMYLAITPQRTLIADSLTAQARAADAVVVAVGYTAQNETEGGDRTFALPIGQDMLIQEMAAANPRTVVAVTAGGSVDASAWIDRVPAYLHLWYPGEQGGKALAEVLFGGVNPSGRLPITFERTQADNPAARFYYPEPGTTQVAYGEGVFVGYRGYEHNGVQPLFPFGYGLSYTTFAYANLSIEEIGQPLAEPRFTVSFDVTNTGQRAGAEVAQVYIAEAQPSIPRPPQELKGFAKVALAPGETRRLSIPLDVRSFAYYEVSAHRWRANAGSYQVRVGRSSADIALTGTATLARTAYAD